MATYRVPVSFQNLIEKNAQVVELDIATQEALKQDRTSHCLHM